MPESKGQIDKTVHLREELSFAKPDQILKAVQILCSDAYGSMLWNLSCDVSEQFFKAWNTTVKLVYGVPRSTFTYLVEGHLAAGHTSLRNQVLSRYSGFYRNLLSSPSKEVRILARTVSDDPRSTTCSNLRYLQKMTGLSQPEFYSAGRIKIDLTYQAGPRSREVETWSPGQLVEDETTEVLKS